MCKNNNQTRNTKFEQMARWTKIRPSCSHVSAAMPAVTPAHSESYFGSSFISFAKRAVPRVPLRTTASANRGSRCSQGAIARTLVSKLNPFHHSVSLRLLVLLLTKVRHSSVMCQCLFYPLIPNQET